MKVRELTIGALVELVAVLLVGVQLEAVGLRAGRVLGRGTGCQAEQNESKCLHGHSAKSTGLHCTALHSRGRPAAVHNVFFVQFFFPSTERGGTYRKI